MRVFHIRTLPVEPVIGRRECNSVYMKVLSRGAILVLAAAIALASSAGTGLGTTASTSAGIPVGVGTASFQTAFAVYNAMHGDMVPLGQSAVTLPYGAHVIGHAPGSAHMHLVVSLAPRDEAALSRLVSEVSTPGSPYYRHYLSMGQFARRFGASRRAAGAVSNALRSAGLVPGALSSDGLSIPVNATVARASSAFHVPIELLRLRGGQVVRFAAGRPEVPYVLRSIIQGVDNANFNYYI